MSSTTTAPGSSTTATSSTAGPPTTTAPAAEPARSTDLVLDPNHDYGDRYADGILPVGDQRYVLDSPAVGQVFLCRQPASGAPGAQTQGPWFLDGGTEYDLNAKISVQGEVEWDGELQVAVELAKHEQLVPRGRQVRLHHGGLGQLLAARQHHGKRVAQPVAVGGGQLARAGDQQRHVRLAGAIKLGHCQTAQRSAARGEPEPARHTLL